MRRTRRSSFGRATSLSVALCLANPVVASLAAAAPAESEDEAKAKVLLDAGIALFDGGDYEAALLKLNASIALDRSPKGLYAKAQTLFKLERCVEAVPLYNEMLATLPEDSPAWFAVKDGLVECVEEMTAQQAAQPAVAPVDADPDANPDGDVDDVDDDPPAGPPPKAWYKDPYAPVLLGLGAVGVGVGGFYLSEASKENASQPEQYDDFAKKGDRVRQLQIRGGVILGVGGALVLAGAIRYAVLGVRGRRAATAFVPAFGPRWSGVSISGRF